MKTLSAFAAAALLCVGAANAQNAALETSRLTDNISITLKGGAITPLCNNQGKTFWENMRGVAGVEIRKQVTPILGVGIEGEWSINTSHWNGAPSTHNVFDASYVGTFGTINFNNLFAGYAGQPRLFEVEAVAGCGWLHSYVPKSEGEDYNSFGTKAGLNLNFNLGEAKAWTVSLKPAVIWDMDNHRSQTSVAYDAHQAAFEIEAGVTYHFGNSNGTHSFKYAEPCDYSAYNDQINALRAANNQLEAANAALTGANADLERRLRECQNRPAQVVKEVKETNTLESVRYVYYRIGSSKIAADQQPNVEMIASYLKANPKATVAVNGYASKDGNADSNIKLAAARAESVKTMLVNKYGIKADRIKAQGNGIGEMFKEDSWNRVAICILNDGE